MKRIDGRKSTQLRPVTILTGIQRYPEGSVQIACGDTVVLCAATVAEEIPAWIRKEGRQQGWITAEYSMLPGSTPGRVPRQHRGRSEEIQRLIGRSLRASTNLSLLGEHTITVDCDVLQADGGTRTAAITGGYVAIALAIEKLLDTGKLSNSPLLRPVCAISCALTNGEILLDPNYSEDRMAEVDMNFVLSAKGALIEVQGTAEGAPFSSDTVDQMMKMAQKAAQQLLKIQQQALG